MTSRAHELTFHYRRLGLFLALALVLPFFPFDRLLGHGTRASAALEAAWVAVLAVAALLQAPHAPRRADWAVRIAGGASGVLMPAITAATGGASSPYFLYLLALPSSALFVVPDLPSVSVLTALGALGGGLWILAREGRGWTYQLLWAYLGTAAIVLSALGASLYWRLWRSEAHSHQARADAERARASSAEAQAAADRQRERLLEAAHAEVTRARDLLRLILQSIPDAVVVSRLDGRVLFLNDAGRQMLGLLPGEPIADRTVLDMVLAEDQPVLLGRRAAFLRGEQPGTDTVRVQSAARVLECDVSGLLVEFDGELALASVARDVTERRELERRLANADRVAYVNTLMSRVAHEINNPMSYVLANLRAISAELEAGDAGAARGEARTLVTESLEGAERVRAIVRTLWDLTRPGADLAEATRLLGRLELPLAPRARADRPAPERSPGEPSTPGPTRTPA